MICLYLFFEYVRPQSIIKWIDILPWSQITVILTATGLLFEKNKKFSTDPASKWMIIFFGVILFSSFTAYYPADSWKSLINYYNWLIVYFLIIWIVNTRERFLIFLMIFMAASFKVSFFGARTWAMNGFSFSSWGITGPPGFFQNSGELAIQMLLFTFISIAIIQAIRPWVSKRKYHLLLVLFPLTGAMTVMASSSRGGQLALVIGALFYLRNKINIKNILVTCLIAGIFFVILPEEQKTRFTEIGDDVTSRQRMLYWERGIEIWKEHKVTGIGYFNFPRYFSDHYPDDILIWYKGAELPHNIFMQILIDLGLLGMFPYLLLIKNTFLFRHKKNVFQNALSEGFNAAILCFYVAGQFVSVAFYPFMWIHLSMAASIRIISKCEKNKKIV